MKKIVLNTGLLVMLSSSLISSSINSEQKSSIWYQDAQNILNAKIKAIQNNNKAKNIILFIGDGMGVSTVTAARILDGQNKGFTGEENSLSFDKFPFTGLVKTYNTDSQTADSAGTMTAMVTGVKTKKGVLSISEFSNRSDCQGSKGHEVKTILEIAEELNKSTGIISTARLTHATPAATFAHSADRDWEHKAEGSCKDIAKQFVDFSYGDGIDVAMGGGRREFMPKGSKKVEGKSGKREDGLDLREVWKNKYPRGKYIENLSEFDSINPLKTDKLLALFNYSHMQYESDRKNDIDKEPSLTQMTSKAIKILRKNKKGYVLIVEAGRIDHAHHAGNAYGALTDTIELSKAVQAADDLTSDSDTLILVTADHSHVFTIAGYPVRGNPILGKVKETDGKGGNKGFSLAADNLPYTTLGYANGRGFMDLKHEHDSDASYDKEIHKGRADLRHIDTNTPGFHQEAAVPRKSETHAGEDVAIYAKGPGSHLVSGTIEQNMIFNIMKYVGNMK